ncbi:phage major capsid protein [Sinorhizobium medicae]|nr:phage major capsid protein [Sinorhizobium medicae]MDX0796705.1 phage major capsid protein [Sinorhizobium medicae]
MNNDPISSDVGVIAKTLLASSTSMIAARSIAEARKSSPRVIRFLEKAAVGAGSMTDGNFGEILADWRISSSAFFTSLRNRSIFFRLLDSGFRRVPLDTPIGMVSASATGWIVGQGQPIPMSKLTLGGPSLQSIKACALIVVTNEVARAMDDASYNLVNVELRGAVSDIVDAEFFSLIMDSSSLSISSSGNTVENMKADLLQLLAFVNTGAGQLLWAMSADVANALSLSPDPFTGMTPIGGELLGQPAYVSAAIPAGTLRLINAASIAANADTISIDASAEADIQMLDNPTNNSVTPTPTEVVSLFQSNSTALKAVVTFGVERVRDNAVAELTDIAWGSTGT